MANIRWLNHTDEAKIIDLLDREMSLNGLLISDLKRTDYKYATVYGSFEYDVLVGVMLVFADKIVYYGSDETQVEHFVPYIISSKVKKMVGKAALMEKFVPLLDVKSVSDSFILELNTEPLLVENPKVKVRKIDTAEEFRRLYLLLRQLEEHSGIDPNVERWVQGQLNAVNTGTVRTVYAEVDGILVSTAASMNETPETAILAGVGTLHEYRNQGIASVLVSVLSKEVIRDGKRMYLFYNNLAAGSIYKRLGFYEVGTWKVIVLNTEVPSA